MDEERASMLPMIAAGEKRETLPVFTTASFVKKFSEMTKRGL